MIRIQKPIKPIGQPELTNQEEEEGFQDIRNPIKDKNEMLKGVGCFKEYQVHLELKEDERPIIHLKLDLKLDLPHAYYQLELDEESRRLTTMSTVRRNVRKKRLSMRLLNAQDFYDERMYQLLHDIKNKANYKDGLIEGGKTLRGMNKTLSKVLKRLNENGLTLSPKKCHLPMKNVEFLGYVFTQNGLKPSPDKVKALAETEL